MTVWNLEKVPAALGLCRDRAWVLAGDFVDAGDLGFHERIGAAFPVETMGTGFVEVDGVAVHVEFIDGEEIWLVDVAAPLPL